MAFVQDYHDPQGLGMFSKAGRFTSEKYIIFQRKDEILYNQKKEYKGSTQPANTEQHNSNNHRKTLNNLDKKKQLSEEQKQGIKLSRKDENQPFTKQISREYANKIKQVKYPPKPVGHYNPKYCEIERHPHYVWDILEKYKRKTLPRIANNENGQQSDDDLQSQIPDKFQNKIHGNVEIIRQCPRRHDFMINKVNNPHEERFNGLKLSDTWSKIPRMTNWKINKQIGREYRSMYINKEHQPDYNPKYALTLKKIGDNVPGFQNLVPRKPFFKNASQTSDHFFDYDFYVKQNKSNIFKETKYPPDFYKMLPREKDPNSPLPSFMQKFNSSRTILNSLSQKMLELNSFSDGKFQSVISSLNLQKDSPKKNISESDEEQEFDTIKDE